MKRDTIIYNDFQARHIDKTLCFEQYDEEIEQSLSVETQDAYRHDIIWEMISRLARPSNPPYRLLDMGWGFGTIIKNLYDCINMDYYACDLSLTALSQQRLEKMKAIKYKDCNIAVNNIPFSKRFNMILLCEVLEHLNFSESRSIDDFVKDIRYHLSDDGYLILSTPNVACIKNILKLCLGRNITDEWDSSFIDSKLNRSPHIREFTIPELIELFKRNGLDLVETKTVYRPTTSILLQLPVQRLKDDIFMVFKKKKTDIKSKDETIHMGSGMNCPECQSMMILKQINNKDTYICPLCNYREWMHP